MADGDVRPEHYDFLVRAEVPLDRNVQKWKRPLLMKTLTSLSLTVKPQGPRRSVTVEMMKRELLEHFAKHPEARETVFGGGARTSGLSISEYEYSNVVLTLWLAKNSPRDWCLTDHQLAQLHGRVVLTGILFSIGKVLPDFHSLSNFGFKIHLEDRRLLHNLETGATHETADQLLIGINKNKRQRLQ